MALTSSIYGTLYTFRVERGGDARFTGWRTVRFTKTENTVRKLLSARGSLEFEEAVLKEAGIASAFKTHPLHKPLRIPNALRGEAFFNVLAGRTGPVIEAGYARIDLVPRSERASLSTFTGYDPILMSVPIHFEAEPGHDGEAIENDIKELEKMAGRGNFKGAAQGAPPRINLTVVIRGKETNNLLPSNYQWSEANTDAPIWWISGIEWDSDPWRDENGNRIRQFATVRLTQYVRPDVLGSAPSSATDRNAANKPRTGTGRQNVDRPHTAQGVGSIR